MFHLGNDKGDNSLTEIPGKENTCMSAIWDATCKHSKFMPVVETDRTIIGK